MFGIYLDRSSEISVTAQLCSQIRQKIEKGELVKGTRLPSTRKLAQEFGIARNVAIDAYEQLIAEGYLIGRTGSGTFVAEGIIAMASDMHGEAEPADMAGQQHRSDPPDQEGIIHFLTGTPDLRSFPRKVWAKYLKNAAEDSPGVLYDYGDIRGEEELRSEISVYLHRTRGMRCSAGQIMIVSGSSEGLALIAKALRPDYSSIYLENPTIEITQHIFRQTEYRITPVEVDESGMKLHEIAHFQDGHLMLLTPSHHFPSGSILSIQRRQHAVRLAEKADSYIIEDDYDGDFRLKGVPIPPLYTLNPDRVIYVGTFSKTLAPGLRIGFLVLPRRLVSRFASVKEELNIRSPSIPQIALARFIRDGRLDRHIHKMKTIYRNRRNVLIEAVKRHFGDRAVIRGDEAGMHVLVEFPQGPFDVDWQRSIAYGVKIHCVEEYSLVKGSHSHQILLGYGNIREEEIETGIERLSRFVHDWKLRN
ncbi:PLP-dependent aminotransferase family protein [Brevibacillus sp. SYP-B805]|uniref:MocR-like pyridoxine biosynthesis transcription factor PdxR n=1 Tax=Brevibacillus sp. SYP-B805 TaxID=1578199 RepID=UPI0013EA70ED|nr:PLP-dependent aminotransferase family protein [Brevibacillus sp. SYP-B805]NGQ95730.1 PLP-dependent aminotransferase family protein [Brevibacillus sp. SYP-B805]